MPCRPWILAFVAGVFAALASPVARAQVSIAAQLGHPGPRACCAGRRSALSGVRAGWLLLPGCSQLLGAAKRPLGIRGHWAGCHPIQFSCRSNRLPKPLALAVVPRPPRPLLPLGGEAAAASALPHGSAAGGWCASPDCGRSCLANRQLVVAWRNMYICRQALFFGILLAFNFRINSFFI